jgi:hypothetical protein
MNLFAQLRKVDEQKRLVFGRIAGEEVDKAEEVMDYTSSKPHFVQWSEDIAKATNGASLGNVRAMHGKVAAGKLTGIEFNDAEKAIDVCAKVVDDNEWAKVLEGVYTGFSIGGAYHGEKKVEKVDGRNVTRYTARPSEVSLVDRPCMPSARFFEVQKADGALAKVDFQHQPEPDPVDIVGTDDQVLEFGKLMNEHGLTMGDVLKAMPAFIADKVKDNKDAKKDGDKPAAAAGEKDPKDADAAKDAAADAEKAAAAADLSKAAEAAASESLDKVESALTDALAKVGARNSGVDAARITKIHDMAVELGAACGQPAEKLAKAAPAAVDTDTLQKLVTDAVAPLQKQLDEAKAALQKIADQPAPARISLRAIAKADDTDAGALQKNQAAQPITDDHGEKHEAAGLIKSLHATGGAPLGRTLSK